MKRSDWALVVLLAMIAGFAAFAITNSITDSQRKSNESAETSIQFSDKVSDPSEYVYSDKGKEKPPINPTVMVNVGTGSDAADKVEESQPEQLEQELAE